MSTTRPVFGAEKPSPKPTTKGQKYKTAARQEGFDFTQPLPDLTERGYYTQIPNEIPDNLIDAVNSISAIRFVLKFARRTAGGQYDLGLYGTKAKALLAKKARPMWVPLTIAEIGAMAGTPDNVDDTGKVTNSGAEKVKALLEDDLKILVSNRANGKVWYALDYEAMKQLVPIPVESRKRAPKPEESNIPHDLPHECASGEPCLRARVAAELGGLPFGDDSQLIEKIRAAFGKTSPEGGFSPTCSDLVQVSGKRKFSFGGGFSPFTLVQKPGDTSGVSTLPDAINGVKFVNANGTLSHKRVRDEGGVLVIEELPPPTADDATVGQWRKPVNAITRKYWHEVLGTSEIADIAGICEAIGATPEDWSRWAEDKCSRKCARNGGKMPAELRARLLVKFTVEDFQSYWLAAEDASRVSAPRSDWSEALSARDSFERDKAKWKHLSEDDRRFYRQMFPDEVPQESAR